MPHIPVNHPLRPLYRTVAGLTGLYVLAFGIVGLIRSWGASPFDRGHLYALGLRTNPTFAVLSILVGVIVIAGNVYGRNVDHLLNLIGGLVFLVAGMAMLSLLQTSLNLLNFEVTTCVVSFVIGLVLFAAGLYGKTGPHTGRHAERRLRPPSEAEATRAG